MRNPKHWLHIAEVVDALRIFPRLFLAITLAWAINMSYVLVYWYMQLPPAERGIEASGFGAVTFSAVLGFLKLVYDTYSSSARDWNQAPPKDPST